MSILAEPRRKQRISIDPQNLQWKNSDQKLSKKLMEKMGWSDGDGLGRSKQGNAEHIKLQANYTGRGLGADKLNSYDSAWISHHDDFADLLTALNKNKEQKPETKEEGEERAKRISIELNSKSIRRRIHYQKFTRAKDTTNYSSNDKSAILGLGLKKRSLDKQEEEKNNKKVENEANQAEIDFDASKTTVSKLSVGEYFAAKMAVINAKKEAIEYAKDNGLPSNEEYGFEAKDLEKKQHKRERKRLRELEAAAMTEVIEQTNDLNNKVIEKKINNGKKRSRNYDAEGNKEEWIEKKDSFKEQEGKRNGTKAYTDVVETDIQSTDAKEVRKIKVKKSKKNNGN